MNDWSMLKKLIWLRIIKGGGGIERTVKGAIVHVINALARPAISVKCEVNPIQDLHGFDSPWPAGGGKNKFDCSLMADAESGAKYIDLTLKPNTAYTASSNDPMASGAADIFFVLPGESVSTGTNGVYNNHPVTRTTGADGVARIGYRAYNGLPVATLVGFETQVEEGSTATAFAPYSNICPISGRTSATVTRTGRNLFDINTIRTTVHGMTVTIDGQTVKVDGTSSASGRATLAEFQFPKAGTYHLHTSGDLLWLKAWNSLGADVTVTVDDISVVYRLATATLTSGTEYHLTATENQIEIGSSFSAYEPYAGNTYTITLGDTVYGGSLDVTGGEMVVDRAMVDMGTLTWSRGGTDTAGIYRFSSNIPTVIAESGSAIPRMLCSQYATVSPNKTYQRVNGVSNNLNIGQVMVFDDAYSNGDVAAFKAAMSGVQLCYELAQPIEITLTATQIDMLLGENNLWADAGDLTLTYYADGNASTSEALGILLGGTYNNPGGADDVSDDEALGILLGGS